MLACCTGGLAVSLLSIENNIPEIKMIEASADVRSSATGELTLEQVRVCKSKIESCLCRAKVKKAEVHDVALLGHAIDMPQLQAAVQQCFDGKQLCSCNVALQDGLGGVSDPVRGRCSSCMQR
jgi:molecular chaperone DnaK (HSP70)